MVVGGGGENMAGRGRWQKNYGWSWVVAAKLCLVLGDRGWWQQNNDWSWVVLDGGVKLWLVVGGGGKIMVARGCW